MVRLNLFDHLERTPGVTDLFDHRVGPCGPSKGTRGVAPIASAETPERPSTYTSAATNDPVDVDVYLDVNGLSNSH